ncbi:MerR family transcriptional regulator [Devosia aquimaris]|uniref:MerR family transcriptional regulator n=1 Tax=Devosia aquimaris TaxID=2866214 RepID=UPI001CD06A3A|nr:MerR family transcriptional regulator [Devosia sp. CJK-A8-3]
MKPTQRSLKHADAARMLGISSKALRLYEDRGLVVPGRTAAGWRVYGPAELARAEDVVALRALGLSLGEVERVLGGDGRDLGAALASQQSVLEARMQGLGVALARVRELRGGLARGAAPDMALLRRLDGGAQGPSVAFDLPWPWGGERFVLPQLARLSFIIGPLGSGKTRLSQRLADEIEGGRFLGLDRNDDGGAAAQQRFDAEPDLRERILRAEAWLADEGATPGPALRSLLVHLDGSPGDTVVVDMVEEGLDEATQMALIAHLRASLASLPRLMLMTRSSAFLDLGSVRADEAIILCPANHSPPSLVAPYPGAPGFEAVETCLAPPEVRARSAGMQVVLPAGA